MPWNRSNATFRQSASVGSHLYRQDNERIVSPVDVEIFWKALRIDEFRWRVGTKHCFELTLGTVATFTSTGDVDQQWIFFIPDVITGGKRFIEAGDRSSECYMHLTLYRRAGFRFIDFISGFICIVEVTVFAGDNAQRENA